MKNILAVFLFSILIIGIDISDAKKNEPQVARVLIPFMPVFRERKPQSDIVTQAHKGDQFPVIRVGKYWVEVTVPPNNETGWLELGMENPKVEIIPANNMANLMPTIIGLLIFVGTIALLSFAFRIFQNSRRKRMLKNIEAI